MFLPLIADRDLENLTAGNKTVFKIPADSVWFRSTTTSSGFDMLSEERKKFVKVVMVSAECQITKL